VPLRDGSALPLLREGEYDDSRSGGFQAADRTNGDLKTAAA